MTRPIRPPSKFKNKKKALMLPLNARMSIIEWMETFRNNGMGLTQAWLLS